MHGIDCVSHKTHIVVKALSKQSVIARIKHLLNSLHVYFKSSSKRYLKFITLAQMLHTKGLKIIRHEKFSWLSMLSPLQHIMSKYRTFIQKLYEDSIDIKSTKKQ